MTLTRYNTYSDEELLNLFDSRDRSGSDLLTELGNRLRDRTAVKAGINCKVECPCCQAPLVVDSADGDEFYTLLNDKDN